MTDWREGFCDRKTIARYVSHQKLSFFGKIQKRWELLEMSSQLFDLEKTCDNGDKDIDIVSNRVVDSDSKNNILSHNLSPTLSPVTESDILDNVSRIRLAARMEYGINGMVDARVLASKLSLSTDVVLAWLDANYAKKRDFVYTQRST